ncbi:MAG TPA: tetratricopeptide repeat protein [Vicinamibacterales bacterium]|nr:tetratricopeptide repeat protein [Vicinamibacterales bacterium]
MDPDRWHRIEEIFEAALGVADQHRAALIESACAGDEEMARSVRAMLAADAGSTLLDADVASVARDVLVTPGDPAAASGIGPYRIKAVLGEGGSGVVYLAVRDDIGNDVAIKVLRDAWVSAHRRERFLAEQRTLARLNHPAIARILDAGVLEGGTPWFALELIDGLRLDEYCRQQVTGVLPLARLFRVICNAVQHAHERLIVHRDLKPSNILVTADGQPKLLDFGIARQLEEIGLASGQTGPLRLLTPGYASPEELRGEAPGVRGDVYSLGKILSERLAELAPPSPATTAWRARWGDAFERSAIRDLRLICDSASHPDPEQRYPTVEALARDLDAVVSRRPINARPATLGYRARKFVGRNAGRLAAIVIVLVVIGSLTAAYAERLSAARAATALQAARSERLLRFVLGLFDGGDRGGAPPADLRVVSLLARGVSEARGLGDDPGAQTEMFHTLGLVYQELGDLDNADRLLADALEHRRAEPASQPEDVVSSLVAMSELRLDQARLDEAQPLAEEATARARESLRPAAPARVAALTALGRVQREKGEYETATATLREALAGVEDPADAGRTFTDALFALSETRFYVGDLTGAETLSRQVLDLSRRFRGENHPRVADALLNLGAIATSRGQHEEAEQLIREALDIFVGWFGEDNPESASAMTHLGQALAAQKRFDEGMALLQKAIAVQERTFGERHPRTAFVHNALGLMAFQANDFARAAVAFATAAAGYGASAGTHFQEGVSYANLGSVYLAQGDNPRAEGMFRRALDIYAAVLPADHVNVGIADAKLGRALLRQQRAAAAEPVLQQAQQILGAQPGPESTWLKAVREDLATVQQRAADGRERPH